MSCLALVMGLAGAAYSAVAEEPFSLGGSEWKSFEGYENRIARHPPPNPPKEEERAAAPEEKKDPAAEEYTNTSYRNTPMPGLNKGFSVEVGSTEEEKEDQPAAEAAMHPDIYLPESKWKPLVPAKPASKLKEDGSEENPPLNVRMTYLPSKALPVTKKEKESAARKGHDIMRRLAEQKKKVTPKTPEEQAACQALDAYKKQQLDALQSDRETLKALQEAIRSLGLTQQLEFMTEQGSTLSSPQVSVAVPGAAGTPGSTEK